jgi:hypothetical protein
LFWRVVGLYKLDTTMKFVDEAYIDIVAGDGGAGCVSFGMKNTRSSAAPMEATGGVADMYLPWPIPT